MYMLHTFICSIFFFWSLEIGYEFMWKKITGERPSPRVAVMQNGPRGLLFLLENEEKVVEFLVRLYCIYEINNYIMKTF